MDIVEIFGAVNELSLTVFVLLTVGLVQVFKSISQKDLELDNDYLPVVSIVVGVLISILWSTLTGIGIVEHIFIGIGFGLAGSGLFDSNKWVKNIINILMPK